MPFLQLYGRVLTLLAHEQGLAVTLAIANLALAAFSFVEPVLFGQVVDALSAIGRRPAEQIWAEAVWLLALWGVVGLVGIVASILVSLHSDRMAHRNRLLVMAKFFEHVMALPLQFHGDTHSGRLIKVMLQGGDNLFGLWLSFFREHLSTFVACLVLLPLTLFMNWRMSVLLIGLVVFFAALTVLVIRHTEQAQGAVEDYHTELAASAADALANVMVVQSFERLAAEARQFRHIIRRVIDAQFPVLTWWAVVSVMTRGASTIAVILIFVFGTVLTFEGRTTVGEVVTFMGFATMLIGRLEQTMGFVARMFFQRPAIEEFFELLDTVTTVPEKPDARPLATVRGEVVFDQVGFAYVPQRQVLADVSFAVKPGMTVALVGHTGSGKTTTMGLLQRLRDPDAGAIRIDGMDLRDATLESLRRAVGVVFQESLLFNRSIAENLRVGKPDATQNELEMAARLAEAHDFIISQVQGYDTLVGERGSTLSGGERQRLSIARALLKNPPILILDEATSALDTRTEEKVQRALKALMAGRTTFVIAHRLSTVRDADLILVFEHGRIVERGSFGELVARGGVFSELVSTQLAPTEKKIEEGMAAADAALAEAEAEAEARGAQGLAPGTAGLPAG